MSVSREKPISPAFGRRFSPLVAGINTPSPARRLAAQEKEITNQIANGIYHAYRTHHIGFFD